MSLKPEALRFWIAVNLTQKTVLHVVEKRLKQEGLPPVRWFEILWCIAQHEEGVRAKELIKWVIFEQYNMSRLLQRMVTQGLVEERPDPSDGRAKLLVLTQEGWQSARQIWKTYSEVLAQQLSKVTDNAEIDAVTDALAGLVGDDIMKRYEL